MAIEGKTAVGELLAQQTQTYTSSVFKYLKKDYINSIVPWKICNSGSKVQQKYNLEQHPLGTSTNEGKTDNHTPVQSILFNIFTKRPDLIDRKRQQITGLLVNFIVKDIRPLAVVRREGFREMPTLMPTSFICKPGTQGKDCE